MWFLCWWRNGPFVFRAARTIRCEITGGGWTRRSRDWTAETWRWRWRLWCLPTLFPVLLEVSKCCAPISVEDRKGRRVSHHCLRNHTNTDTDHTDVYLLQSPVRRGSPLAARSCRPRRGRSWCRTNRSYSAVSKQTNKQGSWWVSGYIKMYSMNLY